MNSYKARRLFGGWALAVLLLAGTGFGGGAYARKVTAIWPGSSPTASPAPITDVPTPRPPIPDPGSDPSASGTWAIYIYMCGADLESAGGLATAGLQQLLSVPPASGVTVVIETGGASQWQNTVIPADRLGRYLYDAQHNLMVADYQPNASMGDSKTLTSFLQYCNANYPADHQAVVFWDHGGGSLYGVEFDENYDGDSLTLQELKKAFDAAPAASGRYEMIGFDTCLMATVDMLKYLLGEANYLVASEESEPGEGWDYAGMLTALNRGVANGAQLGKAICDTYYAQCVANDNADRATLSVADLNKAAPLIRAYRAMGDEAILNACVKIYPYLSAFGRAAQNSETFGPESLDEGYTCMVDLGSLAENAGTGLLPTSHDGVLAALNDCVVYQVKGSLHAGASGLSCYYNYATETIDTGTGGMETFSELGTSKGFDYLFQYLCMGYFDAVGEPYIKNLAGAAGYADFTVTQDIWETYGGNLTDLPIQATGTDAWQLQLDSMALSAIANAQIEISYKDAKGAFLSLGRSTDIAVDWNKGVLSAKAPAAWPALDGVFVSMQPAGTSGGAELYTVPILLNGEKYSLYASKSNGAYSISGARKVLDPTTGMADKKLRKLVAGDVVQPIYHNADGKADSVPQRITVTANTALADQPLTSGTYRFNFVLLDAANFAYLSQPATFKR